MNVSSSMSAILAVPIMGMALAASTLVPPSSGKSLPAQDAETDAATECRNAAVTSAEIRACGAGKWTKAQSAYR